MFDGGSFGEVIYVKRGVLFIGLVRYFDVYTFFLPLRRANAVRNFYHIAGKILTVDGRERFAKQYFHNRTEITIWFSF